MSAIPTSRLRAVSADLIRQIGQGEMMTEEDCAVVCEAVVALRVAEDLPDAVNAIVTERQREAVRMRLALLIDGLKSQLADDADAPGLKRAIAVLENEHANS